MKSVNFCFATHNHQPIGNFDHIIEEAYERSYRPFFELASRYPVRFGTHFTGILLNWLQHKHPEYIASLRNLVSNGTLEMISGGYYEPILSVIPYADQQAQIAKLNSTIRELFAYEAHGMWLAERVWEQPLASSLNAAGIRYVLLDDTHFLAAGLQEKDLTSYYLTEDQGKTLAVFPISKALRYTIPFADVDETIRVLRDAASEDGQSLVCFADDGEKFGVWPRTYEHVYTDGWLDEFFRKLTENSNWISMIHLSEALTRVKPAGRIYLPNASYAEMMQWALPSAETNQMYEDFVHALEEDKPRWERYMPFVRGGYWRNFFAKYPETNQLHKHMLRTSSRIERARVAGADVSEAYDALLGAQCNDPYWHGVFGGAYLTNLRHANFSSLVRADALLEEQESSSGIRVTEEDFDCDGAIEVILESRDLSLFVKPESGGTVCELDLKPRSFNVMNSITRREEAYHHKITKASEPAEEGSTKSIHDMVETKEAGLEKLLAYDWYRHGCMIDHFFGDDVTPELLKTMQYEELGDFVLGGYEHSWDANRNTLTLSRHGSVQQSGTRASVYVQKDLTIEGSDLFVTYRILNEAESPVRLRFGSEWLFNLLAGDAHDRYYVAEGGKLEDPKMNSTGSLPGAGNIRLVDEFLQLKIELNAAGSSEIWRLPIESVSLSEAGFERVYQGSLVIPVWNVELEAGAEWLCTLEVRFGLSN